MSLSELKARASDKIESIHETAGDMEQSEASREVQARAVGPSSVAYELGAARSGEDWIKHLCIMSMPSKIEPGIIDIINTHPNASIEPVVHFSPGDSKTKITELKNAIQELKVRLRRQQKVDDPDAEQTMWQIAEHQYVRNQLKSGTQKLWDVGVYVRIRGESKDAVRKQADSITKELSKKDVTVRTIDYQSDDALTATSPAAKDSLGGVSGQMLGDAVGAMFPFSASTLYEPDGIPFGYHAVTDEPFQLDRYNRDGGYNVLTIGELGMGKSFGTMLLLLRRMAMDPDTILVMIDPVGGFDPLATQLNAQRVPLGGDAAINPTEIQPTPPDVVEREGLNPFNNWISTSMGWFDTYFSLKGDGSGLEMMEDTVMRSAIRGTAYRMDITEDPRTHHNPSPTPLDIRETVGMIADDPMSFHENIVSEGEYTANAESADIREPENWIEPASKLYMAMEDFNTGNFANMARQSEGFNLDAKATYIDTKQGGTDKEKSLRLQAPLNVVYQRAQNTDKRMVIAIDEIHRLFETPNSLDWLVKIVRHSRHFDISMHMITQQASDFFVHPKAETLAGLASHKIIHKETDLSYDPYGKKLGLSPNEAQFARTMNAGTPERGYAHALVDVDDHGTYPIKVTPLPEELLRLEGDSDENKESAATA